MYGPMHRRTLTRTFATGARARLNVENRDGSINVRVHDRDEVTLLVTADIYADSGRDSDVELERIDRGITGEGDRVDVRVPDMIRPLLFFGRGPRVDYEIAVPRETSVVVESRNGGVTVRGVSGPVEIENRNGSIAVDEVAAAVKVGSRNGKVTLTRCGLNVPGPDSAPGVRAETSNGSLSIEDAGSGVSARTSNGSLRFSGAVKGDVTLSTTNGGIRMAVPRGSRFEVDAESDRGSVHSDLDVRGRPVEAGANGKRPKVTLRTSNGSIRIGQL